MEDKKFADGGYTKLENIISRSNFIGFNLDKVKQKDVHIDFRCQNMTKRFVPQEDITILELNKVYAFMFCNMFGDRFDIEYYIAENGLERHFVEVYNK